MYRESAIPDGPYLVLFHTSTWSRCDGLEIGGPGIIEWYDSERDTAIRCTADVLPHFDSLDLVLVAIKGPAETNMASPHPSTATDFGGSRPLGSPMGKRQRDVTASGDIDGYVSGPESPAGACVGGAAGQVRPTELMSVLRAEIEEAEKDAKTPYPRWPQACRLFPIRNFDRRSRLRGHIAKDRDATEGRGVHLPWWRDY